MSGTGIVVEARRHEYICGHVFQPVLKASMWGDGGLYMFGHDAKQFLVQLRIGGSGDVGSRLQLVPESIEGMLPVSLLAEVGSEYAKM